MRARQCLHAEQRHTMCITAKFAEKEPIRLWRKLQETKNKTKIKTKKTMEEKNGHLSASVRHAQRRQQRRNVGTKFVRKKGSTFM